MASLQPFFGLPPPREFESRLVPSFSQKQTGEPVRFCDGQGEPNSQKRAALAMGRGRAVLGYRGVSVKGFGDWGKDDGQEMGRVGRPVNQRAGWRAPEGRKKLSDSPDGPESVALNNRVVNSPVVLTCSISCLPGSLLRESGCPLSSRSELGPGLVNRIESAGNSRYRAVACTSCTSFIKLPQGRLDPHARLLRDGTASKCSRSSPRESL